MENFSIGRALSRTFQIIGTGFGSVGVFLLIVSAVNTAVSFFAQSALVSQLGQATNPADPAASLQIFTSVWYWLTLLSSMVIGALMYSGSIYGYLRVASGKPISLAECFTSGFAKLLPMLGLTLLWILAISFASMLLLVPGLILATVWAVVMPALVGEDRGVFESFDRSRNLTRGSRWPVFGALFILLVVIYFLMAVLLGGMMGGALLGGGSSLEKIASMANPISAIVSAAIGWATSMLLCAAITAIYLELLQVKEGGTAGELGEVFG